MLPEQIAATMLVANALEHIGVPYAIGGSFASALHGVMRATMDVALVADLREEDIAPLVQALDEAFYAEAGMMHEAIIHRGSFNLIHLESMFKVDVFVAQPRDFDRAQLARRQLHLLAENPEQRAYVTSAEDTVLAKLEWYRLGAESSERQWRDALGILKVQGQRLDLAYMRRMAAGLGVQDQLERILGESTCIRPAT